MMKDKKFVGIFNSETEVLTKVEELEAQGFTNDNIYVIAKEDKNLSMLRGRATADTHKSNESWIDRFVNFLSGEDHVRSMTDRLGFDENESARYYSEIENGGILLYVDEGEVNRLYEEDRSLYGVHGLGTDPALNTTMDNEKLFKKSNSDQFGRNARDEETMRLHEERLEVDKREVERGNVSLEKNVVEDRQSIDVPVTHEEIYVERRPVHSDEISQGEVAMGQTDETIRIPVTEEKLEVRKKPVVAEEIVIGKRKVEDVETVEDTVKREEVHLERHGDVEIEGDLVDDHSRTNTFNKRF